jgi:hypothetical protein
MPVVNPDNRLAQIEQSKARRAIQSKSSESPAEKKERGKRKKERGQPEGQLSIFDDPGETKS